MLAAREASDRSKGAASAVSVRAGATALNRMPCRAYVIDAERTIPSIAPLAAAITSCWLSPWRTATVLTRTIDPAFWVRNDPQHGPAGQERRGQVGLDRLGELLGGRQVQAA